MIEREKLNDRQLALLKRIAEGDDLSGQERARDRQSAYALSNRGLITVSKRGGVFRAQLAGAGRARLRQAESAGGGAPEETTPSAASTASKGKRRAPDATVETAKLRTSQAAELMAKLADNKPFRVERPTDEEAATWRKVVDFAKRNGFVPPGMTLERRSNRSSLVISLVDGVHPNTKPSSPEPEVPVVRVPETLRGCHAVVAKLRDDEHRVLMPKPQRWRCLLILQAIASEAQRHGHRVKDEPVETNRYAYFDTSVHARDGAIRVEIDGHGFAVRVSQVSPNSQNPEKLEALKIDVPQYRVQGRQTRWPDGKRRKVEDVLDLILPELETQAAEEKQRQIDEDRAKAERRTNWEKAMERARAAAATAYKVKILNKQIESWRRAATLREYVDALADRITEAENGEEQIDDEMLAWAKWITEYTAAIDPLTSIPKMPDIPEPSPEDLKPFLGKWSPYGPEETSDRYGWRN